jgi:hypothetical protein
MQKNTKPLPSYEEVNSLLEYDCNTGNLKWRRSLGKAKAGSIAGCLAKGYILIGINKRLLKAHRLAWLLHFKIDPVGDIDHKNGIRSDNRIDNLRIASHSENMHNRCADHDNKSGIKGVCWCKRKRKWMAYVNGKNLGYFTDIKDAEKKAIQTREIIHGEFACSAHDR